MTAQDSATHHSSIAVSSGTALSALAVLAFSLTFPATDWGLRSFGPWSLVALRGLLAALVAGGFLLGGRIPVPERRHWVGLAVVAGGTVVGFPLLTTLALQVSTSAHAAVVVGLLPLTTAAFAAVRTGRRPSRTFWLAALAGAAVVVVFTVQQSGGDLSTGDLYLFASLLVCAAGYTEGGRLARVMPGWQVIGWALVGCLPLSMAGTAVGLALEPVRVTAQGVAGLVWLSAGSAFFGLYVWYRGMASIGIAKASQLQLAQPVLTLVWSVLLLDEHLTPAAPAAAAAILVCIAVTQRAGTASGPASRTVLRSGAVACSKAVPGAGAVPGTGTLPGAGAKPGAGTVTGTGARQDIESAPGAGAIPGAGAARRTGTDPNR